MSTIPAAFGDPGSPKARRGKAHVQNQAPREIAVLVAVEFPGAGRGASAGSAAGLAAKQARAAAEIAEPAGNPELHFDAEMEEFRELAMSAGAEVAALLVQRRARPDPATLVGGGKLEEIAALAASAQADVVLFGNDLTATQLRNLEKRLPCRVIDRTQLILDIFARHARTREGHLQVELAQLEYMLPRLTGRGKSMSQLGGGIGTRGPGETQLETDRRRIRQRIDHLKEQLESVRRVRREQGRRREANRTPMVALVGYTNAGKSTLFNALTEAQVLASSRMFATLDPKIKGLRLPSRRKVLLADTVGFIRNLPHTLVSAFRATLEAVENADVLLHVRDASSPMLASQKVEVEKVLAELEVLGKPVIEVLNKSDLLAENERSGLEFQDATLVSALRGTGLDELAARIDEALVADPLVERVLCVPQARGDVLAEMEADATVLEKRFEAEAVWLRVKAPASLMLRLSEFVRREKKSH
jgi:GTP-binding protein HflX